MNGGRRRRRREEEGLEFHLGCTIYIRHRVRQIAGRLKATIYVKHRDSRQIGRWKEVLSGLPELGMARVYRRAIQISRTRNTFCPSLSAKITRTSTSASPRDTCISVAAVNSSLQSDCRCCSSPFDLLSVIVILLAGLYLVLVTVI
jgi:hypothetical protein